MLALVFAGLLGPACLGYPTATYSYTDNGPDGRQRTYQLMLPTDIPVIRGLLIQDNTTSDSRGDYQRAVFNEFLHLHGFGYVGGFSNSINRHDAVLNAFMRGLTNFAGQSGHKELLNVPFVFWGFSSSASIDWLHVLKNPSRAIAFCALHAGLNTNGAVVYSPAAGVPITIFGGEKDSSAPTGTMSFVLDTHRPVGALWSFSILQGVDHREVNQSALGIPFLDRMIRRRYSQEQNPLNGPIRLLPIDEAAGWLADNSTWQSGLTYVTNFANYAGNPQTTSWLPDAGIANVYRALATYNQRIKITSVGGQAVVPATPAVLNPQSDIQIIADASAFTGWTQLDFYNQDQLLGSVTSGAAQFTLKNAAPGVYSFIVLGKNAQGAVATSQPVLAIVKLATAPVFSFVNPAGNLELTSPVAGGVINAPASIPLNASINANQNPIARVDFFEGLNLIGSAAAAPYSFFWQNVPAGTYQISAQAVDTANNLALSKALQVTVAVPNNQPPTVSLTSPANGASYAPSVAVLFAANTADADGRIVKVDFFVGAKRIGTATQAPFNFTWLNPPAGEYVCTARATDNANSSTTSAPVKIKIATTSSNPPSVQLNTPAHNSKFTQGSSVPLSAAVSGNIVALEKVSFYAGEVLLGTLKAAPFTLNWTGVPAGNYLLTAEVADRTTGVSVSAPVEIAVTAPNANAAPNVFLTSPEDGAVYDSPGDVLLSANAADSDGSVKQVIFFQGSTLIGTVTSSPFNFVWKNPPAGAYAISAQATDDKGASTTSTAVSVTINPPFDAPPVAAFTSPATGAVFPKLSPINLTVNASDSDGIARVDFFAGNLPIGSVSAPPYALTWTNPGAGSYVLNAVVTDNLGASTTVAPVTISVSTSAPPGNSLPSVSLTAPADQASFTAPAMIQISATATDSDGTIQQVDFFQGATLLGSTTQAPFGFLWSNVPAGNYVLTAKATDNANGATTSTPIMVNVTTPPPNQPPAVTIIAPADGATFTAPATISIAVNATDSDGTVARVDLLQNNAPLASFTAPPFIFNWTNVPAGNYLLVATAVDNLGTGGASLPVNIVVTPPAPLVLGVSRAADSITLSWSGNAILESADTVPGVWSVVPGVNGNSLNVTTGAANKFYRLRQ